MQRARVQHTETGLDEPSPTAPPIRVLVADDDTYVREAVAELVAGEPSFFLVGVASDANEAATLASRCAVDVAVVDVRMPGDGHRAVREIRAHSPRTRVIAFSAYADHDAVVEMLASGATSYLLKGTPGAQVIDAIRRAARGESTLSDDVTGSVVGALADQVQHRQQDLANQEQARARIEQALAPDAIHIVYQPLFDLRDGRRMGVEALARFADHPQRPPDQWFDEAWQVGLGVELELAAVQSALPALERLAPDEFLAINVSPAVVESPQFARTLPAGSQHRLVIEITEHAAVQDYRHLGACLEELRRSGLRLAIDDAGAGYSSLQHILRLDPDVVKLDMSLTRNVHADLRRRALVAALVPFATEIGSMVVAEGIETYAELSTLREYGVPWGQGFLPGRPGPLTSAAPQLAEVAGG